MNRPEHGGLNVLAKKLARAGALDDALELFRSEPDTGSFAYLDWVADLAAGEGDMPLLSRMARVSVLSAGRLAQVLITRDGADRARDGLRDLLAGADSGDYRALRAPTWRLPLAAGLRRAGYPAEGRALVEEVLADAQGHEQTLAREILIEICVDTRDVEELRRQMRSGDQITALVVVDHLSRAGDVDALQVLSDDGFRRATDVLVVILVGRRDIDRLRRAARSGDGYVARELARLLIDAGQYEEACVLLEPFCQQRVDGPNSPERAESMFWETISLDRRSAGMAAPPGWVEWVAVAIGSGVLGNAAYQVLIESATRAWNRLRAQPQASVAPPASPPAAPAAPAHRTEREAFLLACIAVHDHCEEIEAEVPDFDRVGYDAMNTGEGRWVFTIREAGGRTFTVRIPPPRANNRDIVVAMYVTRKQVAWWGSSGM